VGKGKSNDEGKVFPLDVKAGDRVLFGKYSGTEIKIDGEELLIMREEEVLGIVKNSASAPLIAPPAPSIAERSNAETNFPAKGRHRTKAHLR